MSRFAYYAEPPVVFEGYAGPVVPAHLVYNGFGEPVGAIPLIAALAPLAAQLIGSLVSQGSGTDGVDGFGEYGDGLGLYAGTEVQPAQLVMNGFGEPVGAIPFLAALAPLAAKAAGFLAPLAAKAAGALVPLASKAASAIVPLASKAVSSAAPMLQNVAAQALPAMANLLPGLLARQPAPAQPVPVMPAPGGGGAPLMLPPAGSTPGFVPAPGPMPGTMPPPPGMTPFGPRRRRRRRWLRVVRPAPRIMREAPPGASLPAPAPLPPPPATATPASGGMGGYFGWPMGEPYACARCGGVHALGYCPF